MVVELPVVLAPEHDHSASVPLASTVSEAMLACARIGAVHSVVFGGLSAEAVAGRPPPPVPCRGSVMHSFTHLLNL